MNPDYENDFIKSMLDNTQVYTKSDVDTGYFTGSHTIGKTMINSAATTAGEMRRRVMARGMLIKEALILLAKFKDTRLKLEHVEAQMGYGPMDPLSLGTNYIVRFVDADKQYMKEMLGGWNDVKDTFLMLINERDFEPQYTVTDHELGIKPNDYDVKTLVKVRLAARIFLNYQNVKQ